MNRTSNVMLLGKVVSNNTDPAGWQKSNQLILNSDSLSLTWTVKARMAVSTPRVCCPPGRYWSRRVCKTDWDVGPPYAESWPHEASQQFENLYFSCTLSGDTHSSATVPFSVLWLSPLFDLGAIHSIFILSAPKILTYSPDIISS